MPTPYQGSDQAAHHAHVWADAEGQLRQVCREQRETIGRLESEIRRLKRELSVAMKVKAQAVAPAVSTPETESKPRIVSLVRKRG